MNTPKYIVLHCTDVSSKKVPNQFSSVNAYHKYRGFPISTLGYYGGYHILVSGGKKYRYRADKEPGVHTAEDEMNVQSLAICYGGDGDIELPNSQDTALIREQIKEWMAVHHITLDNIKFHREYSHLGKSCPGSLITREWLKSILSDKDTEQIEKQEEIERLSKQVTILQKLVELYTKIKQLRGTA